MVAGREATPQDLAATERLRRYWLQKIPFGTPGSFTECVKQVEEHTPMKGDKAKGYCADLYHRATGRWPGDHNHQPGDGR